MLYFLKKKKKRIIYTDYNNWIFLHRSVKEIFIQEIFWALGKIIYFIYKIIFFFLNLTEIKKFKFCFLKIIFQNSDENKIFKLVETKILCVCLFETYTTYDLYFRYVLHSSSLRRIFFSNIYQM